MFEYHAVINKTMRKGSSQIQEPLLKRHISPHLHTNMEILKILDIIVTYLPRLNLIFRWDSIMSLMCIKPCKLEKISINTIYSHTKSKMHHTSFKHIWEIFCTISALRKNQDHIYRHFSKLKNELHMLHFKAE